MHSFDIFTESWPFLIDTITISIIHTYMKNHPQPDAMIAMSSVKLIAMPSGRNRLPCAVSSDWSGPFWHQSEPANFAAPCRAPRFAATPKLKQATLSGNICAFAERVMHNIGCICQQNHINIRTYQDCMCACEILCHIHIQHVRKT